MMIFRKFFNNCNRFSAIYKRFYYYAIARFCCTSSRTTYRTM